MQNPHRRSYDIPKPDTGLAEWTSKIKAMQRQVDADEEAEQRRLEEEIAASRLARLRRSHGTEDSSKRSDFSKGSPTSFQDNNAAVSSDTSRYTSLLSASRAARERDPQTASTKMQSSTDTKPPPMSLAAFMGGHATGPRLNRHAPQQDAHDPAQFHQRKDGLVAHPIFGKGGVAMPGMAGRGFAMPEINDQKIVRPPDVGLKFSSRRSGSPPTAKREDLQPGPMLRLPNVRERTTSTSTIPAPTLSMQVKHDLAPLRSTTDLKVAKQDRSTAPRDQSPTVTQVAKPLELPVTHQDRRDSSKSSPKTSITTPSLARPIHPQPRVSMPGPQIPVSEVPSPAFLRSPPQKDLTPSISRLQGRGFVQSMVKVSKHLESSPASDGDLEYSRQANGRRISVLDRWQPNSSESLSQPASPTPKPMRRSVTVDPISAASDRQHASVAVSSGKLKSTRSSSTLRQSDVDAFPLIDASSESAVDHNESPKGLGSATTLLVYKPTLSLSPAVDEFGLKNDNISSGGIYTAGGLPASSGKPLSHPTKGRARKPLKSKQPESNVHSSQRLENNPELSTAHPGPSSVELSDRSKNPLLISKSLTTVKNASDIGMVVNQLADTITLDPSLTGSVNIPEQSPNHLTRRALPGMVAPERLGTTAPPPPSQDRDTVPDEAAYPSSAVPSEGKVFVSMPPRHPRIPNTGKRATAMDVASALSTQSPESEPVGEASPPSSRPAPASQPRSLSSSAVHTEKRKSNQEKYSATILPSLKEETTPTTSPATPSRVSTQQELASNVIRKHEIATANDFDVGDELPRSVNIEALVESPNSSPVELKTKTISVDVILVAGTTTTIISQNQAIFYDAELLAIVHRSKSRTTNLVSTVVWAWRGKRCTLGEKEDRKLQELAKRYGTSADIVQQYSEPPQLVHVLGGQLIIRQGMRAHWTQENTTMHLVRSKDSVIYIDEHDLSIKSLCSGFSYCLSVLGTVYVWYGCGSTPRERQAALHYARSLGVDKASAIELFESEKDGEDMFWTILGDEDYANADYWKWRSTSPIIDPSIWRVNVSNDDVKFFRVNHFSQETCFHSSVYIIDCVWELYVMVGSDAGGYSQDIRVALRIALELSSRVAPARPYPPTVHVLTLPSQLPRDLCLNFRELDELSINKGHIPDHMNIISSMEALDHLRKTSWNKLAAGVDP